MTVDYPQVGAHMRDMFEKYKPYKEKAKRQAYKSRTEFRWEAMRDHLGVRLDHHQNHQQHHRNRRARNIGTLVLRHTL